MTLLRHSIVKMCTLKGTFPGLGPPGGQWADVFQILASLRSSHKTHRGGWGEYSVPLQVSAVFFLTPTRVPCLPSLCPHSSTATSDKILKVGVSPNVLALVREVQAVLRCLIITRPCLCVKGVFHASHWYSINSHKHRFENNAHTVFRVEPFSWILWCGPIKAVYIVRPLLCKFSTSFPELSVPEHPMVGAGPIHLFPFCF